MTSLNLKSSHAPPPPTLHLDPKTGDRDLDDQNFQDAVEQYTRDMTTYVDRYVRQQSQDLNTISGTVLDADAISDAAQAQSDASAAISSAATAQGTADGKVTTFYEDSEPTAEGVGDLWVDTNDGNKLYRWSGSAWVEIQDDAISTAISNAATAQSTADGKIVSFYQTSTPTADGVGDFWIDTDDDNHLYRWNGSVWVTVRDGSIAQAQSDASQAISDAATAQGTADGKVTTFYQTGAPTAEGTGDLWIDTDDGNKLYRWSGSAWTEIQDDAISTAISNAATAQSTADGKIVSFYQDAAPTADGVGDFWIDTDDKNHLYRWNGSAWASVRDTDIAQAISDASNAQATADGKILSFYQDAEPGSGMSEGDLWIDTNDDNRLYRYSGSAWIDIQDGSITSAQSDASQAITDASTAQSTADGKVTTFIQASAPTAEGTGDLWIDSDDDNQMYRWSGSAWVSVRDATIAAAQADASQAISDAATAQGTADGKVTTFIQTGQPTAEGVGDLWIDSDDGNTLYRWSGSAWVSIQDSDISTAISNAATAQSTADGKIISFYQTSSPTAESTGDFWIDTDDDNHLYRWNGASWISVRDATIAAAQADASQAISNAATAQGTADGKVTTFYQASAPTAEGVGDLWIDTDDGNTLYRWSGSAWVSVVDSDIATAISNASTAQSTADGKIVSFYQDSAPTAEGVGDLWTDTNDDNKLYRWSGSAWVSVRDASAFLSADAGDLAGLDAVDTDEIEDDAVTEFASASGGGSSTTETLASVSFNPSGSKPVIISGSFNMYQHWIYNESKPSCIVTLSDGSASKSVSLALATTEGTGLALPFYFEHRYSPATGSKTYSISQVVTNWTNTSSGVVLTVQEVKK